MKRILPLVGLALFTLIGCKTAPPDPYRPQVKVKTFSNTDWATVLTRVVTSDGWVRWDALQNNDEGVRENLFRYVGLIAVVSPENRSDLFKTDDAKLAYYINAYNALYMDALLEHKDPGSWIFDVGGKKLTLKQLLDTKIRSAGDARVHFALNDCTRSAPKLRNQPYEGDTLQQQLAEQGRRFLSDPYGAVREGDRVKLSEIFKTYEDDFMAGYEKKSGHRPAGLLQAIELYAAPDSPVLGAKSYTFMSYDRSLNAPPPPPPR